MSYGDADMMEAGEVDPTSPAPAPSSSEPNDVKNLLSMARQFLAQSNPSQALQAVVMAMKIQGGDEAVSQALKRAREMYINKIQATSAADELASLFAECAIAEAMPSQQAHKIERQFNESDAQGSSILAETGRKQIMVDAYSDGSSFVCLHCGGLVSNHRKEEHYAFWCCKI